LLRVCELTKRFPPRQGDRDEATVPGVFDVSFDVARGEIVALFGPIGCGKTTVLNCVLQLTAYDAGRVFFDGAEFSALRGSAQRAKRCEIQVVLQDAYRTLDPRLSVSRIMEEPLVVHRKGNRRTRERAVIAGLQTVNLSPTVLKRRPSELSIGERQRVAIGRALLLAPKLLILDEPTSGLDTVLRRQIADLVYRAARRPGCGALLVTHDRELATALADRIAVMEQGRVIIFGNTSEVLNQAADE
jgi:peptide/nickel transport system ATP-binding protein